MADHSGASQVETDIVVVGGGGSGLAAAIEARTLGRRVVLIEKNEALGGSTAWSVGSITATNTPHQLREGVLDTPQHHFEDIALFGAYLGVQDNLVLRRLLVDNVGDTFRWLTSMGLEFFGPMPEPPHRKPRMHNVLPNSRSYIHHLSRRARKLGVDIRAQVRARKLLTENRRVVGVLADTLAGPITFRARGGIVLATGDFAANTDMRAKYLSPKIALAEVVNPTNTGDGHQMAMELGGRLVHSHLCHSGLRLQPPPPSWITALPPHRFFTRLIAAAMTTLPDWVLRPFMMSFLTTVLAPDAALFDAGAILVNRHGERFADERSGPGTAIAHQPDKLCYILMDAHLTQMFSKWPHFVSSAPGIAYSYIPDYRRTRKDVFNEGDTLDDLAAKLGIPAQALNATVASFNAEIQDNLSKGADDPRRPLGTGPYVAMGPVRYYISFSDSGLAVDEHLRVLGEGDQPIEGLYAVGFVGMGGVLLEGHGHHLGWAFTSGRLAGRHAAYSVVSKNLATAER